MGISPTYFFTQNELFNILVDDFKNYHLLTFHFDTLNGRVLYNGTFFHFTRPRFFITHQSLKDLLQIYYKYCLYNFQSL